ncbi:MAG: RecQ family ATP-dependent DNA helicase [Saprospiraceae bacterium]
MSLIAFIDVEVEPKSRKILDIGCVKSDGALFHKTSVADFIHFLSGAQFICGHNIFKHDIRYIGPALHDAGIDSSNFIDTLYLSPLLFPTKPYHALLKDDKLQSDEVNNPLNDAGKARDLFNDEVAAFRQSDETLRQIFWLLLKDQKEFRAFFRFVGYSGPAAEPEKLIRQKFQHEICEQADLLAIIKSHPVELAYCLSLIDALVQNAKVYSITPPWVLRNYPEVERLMFLLRDNPCLSGCAYCNKALDIHAALKKFFGFESFRTYGGQPLQEQAVEAAVRNKSIVAIFPTGGGKSLTFQLPALMSGESIRGLTVVISPLQSLMKDQVDNLEKIGLTDAVTINGLLDPVEKAKSIERVEDGSATLLYISPESLRSKTIERLLLGRTIVRFVIDEAHCFSAWGQDFRVDYLYIGDFIRQIQDKKNLEEGIPVSCFTATAKQKVVEDIRAYFKEKLSLDLEVYTSKASRTNLKYKIFNKNSEDEKYQAMRDLVLEKNCPTIIYVSRTRKAFDLADRLTRDGFNARPYHGQMDVKEKTANQDAFISGEIQIIVATSAFGMGIDKKDIGMVIHYEISDSLENYIQEAGRAGRDENMTADCYVLFNENDLDKHFILLNQTKISIKEIQQIWKAVKDATKLRSTLSNSALEIARRAGWDDSVYEIETRVKTAIAALEDAGYVKRGQNMPKIFASSILAKNVQEAIEKIRASDKFNEKDSVNAIRIIKKLISSRSRKRAADEEAESRIDYISDHLGILKEETLRIVNLLREANILADDKDLTAYVKRGENKNRSLHILDTFVKIENFLMTQFEEWEKKFHIKELNEDAEAWGCGNITPSKLKIIVNFWAIKNWIKRQYLDNTKNHLAVLTLLPKSSIKEKLEKRSELAQFIVGYLYERSNLQTADDEKSKDEILVEFSVRELSEQFRARPRLFPIEIGLDDVEDALFFLSRIEAIKIEGGFLVAYNQLSIERLERDNLKKYTKEDYRKLFQYYENKIQQIHIVGEYAKKMISDYKEALQFVDDYFQLNYQAFLHKYFKGSRQNEIKKNITPSKFRQLFGELSPAQLKIINDNESKYIVVAAGPGSGKTKILVHKLASLLLMEDVKHEQLLMLTFSRAAATEFKKRLITLIGNAATYVEIKTFHSFCFDLLGKVGNLEKSGEIIKKAIEHIQSKEVEISRITKTVLVIDEAQDMDEVEFNLIRALMEQNEEMRVIAVGDDDQNIYEFRGASAKYLERFISENKAVKYELVENYRSKANLVDFANQFVSRISRRLKSIPIVSKQTDNGRIKLVRYQSKNLVVPLVNDICASDLKGTVCVLTWANEAALEITGLLSKLGMRAKLIQTNDGFNLYNLAELRFFTNQLNAPDDVFVISDEFWLKAQRALFSRFHNSENLELCQNIIKDFEAANPKIKYKSDWEIFIRESQLEDFFGLRGDTIFVSTIHKAKGKEFDNIFLMLSDFNGMNDQARRLLYVAMTRAKQNLSIHLNSGFLDNIAVENIEKIHDDKMYSPPNEIVMQLSHKDVWLDYFLYVQDLVAQLTSGDTLILNGDKCLNAKGQIVVKFSQHFMGKIESKKKLNYAPTGAKVNFIVYWKKDGATREIAVVLPDIYFSKQNCD